VWLGACCPVCAQQTACPCPVVYDNPLFKRQLQLLRQKAGKQIGGTARGERRDDPHGFLWPRISSVCGKSHQAQWRGYQGAAERA
ncbi:MAG TPA: hypothetical protein VLS47_05870, partial [Gallionella sp.]|nr:hypothetical protein [Gallionella sp.]